ncbi:MAG: sporulation protein YqfD [Defluviitaleaceae bacterium]|nr:sporulation protein YqfD [Defluviitaleaceae bacterium]
MLKLFQLVKGNVRVRVTGFGLERFLNMAAYHGIFIWDVERVPEGIHFSVSIKGFKMLKACARKTKCRSKIIKKNGLPFFLFRHRKRRLLLGGVLFFVVGIFMLSSFVWDIEILGNEAVSHEAVMAFVEDRGLRVGAPKWRNNDRDLQREILNNFGEISWADVHTRGTRTTIMLAEAIPPQEIINRSIPTHVVATSDGLITAIVAGAGAPMVRQNDVVQAGEILVSGILELEPDTPGTALVYVHAHAEVWARRYHNIEFAIPLNYTEKIPTGETAHRRTIQLLFAGNLRFALPGLRPSFQSYDRTTTMHQPGAAGNYPLPIILIKEHFTEFTPQNRQRTPAEAKALAETILTNRLIREFDFSVDIISRQLSFTETPENILVSAEITTHERIDKQVVITVE